MFDFFCFRDCYLIVIAIVFYLGFFYLLKETPEPFVLFERGGLDDGGFKLF
jgi:hypothetical protein